MNTEMSQFGKIILPPDNSELTVKLPQIIHTQNTFIRLLIQLDFDKFSQFIRSPQFQSRLAPQNSEMKTFVDILNSYKQNPFMALAICDNTTFEMIGLIVVAASDHDTQLEFIIDVAEKY